MDTRDDVAKNNIIYTAGNIVAAVLSFVFSVVVANLLQPEQFGLFSFALVVMGFFSVFTDVGTVNTLIRFVSLGIEKGEKSVVRSLVKFFLKLRIALSAGVGGLMVLLAGPIASFVFNKPEGWPFVMLAAGLLISNAALDFVNNILLGFKNFRAIVSLKLLERILRILFVVPLVLLGFGTMGASWGVILGFSAVAIAGFFVVRRRGDIFSAAGPGFKRAVVLSFGFWSMVGVLVSSLYRMIDALAVSMVMSATDVGFYSIASSWMTLITYVVPVSYVVMYPYFSSLNRERNFRALESSMKYLLIPALPLSLIMSAFSEPIIGIFYGQAFAPAAGALSLLSFVAITIVASQMLLGYFYGIGRPRLYINIILAVFVGSIGLTFFMTASFGIWGAAAAMLVSRVIEVAVLLAAALLSSKSGFGWPGFIKPFIAGIVIYAAALQLSVHGIIELVAYGVILLAFYFAIMLAIKGIDRSDVRKILSWLSRR